MKNQKIVIIGANAAGMSCASKAARSAENLDIRVYQSGNVVSYSSCGIPYYVGGLVRDRDDLIARTPEQFSEKLGIEMCLNCRVEKVNPALKKIYVLDEKSGEQFEDDYDKLVIAVGAKPIVPGFVDPNLENVFTATKIDDAVNIRKALEDESVKNVVIAGSGYIGIEMLENIIKLGKNVRIIDRNDRVLHTFDGEITDLISQEIGKYDNVSVHTGESIEGLVGESKVESIRTDKGEYSADLIIMALGIRPDTDFLKDTGIEMLKNGAISVSRQMETSFEGVYAAGDCASVYHRLWDEQRYMALGTVANKQGKLLGEILSGSQKTFPGIVGSVVTRIMDLTVARTGLGEKEAKDAGFNIKTHFVKTRDHAGYYPGWSRLYIKLVYDECSRRLLGAQMAGEKGVALRVDVFATAIQAGMTLDEIGFLDLVYAPPFSGVWDAVNVAANSAK